MSLRARGLNLLLRVGVKRKLARIRQFGPRVVADIRENLERSSQWMPAVPDDVHIAGVDAGGVAAEWVVAGNAAPERVVLYLHGGAYLSGNPRLYRDLAARLSRACAAAVLVPDYRLAPEHRFPAALDDARTALQWLRREWPMRGCAIGGDSAGGGLALATLVAERDAGRELPACGFTFSPWTDLAGSGDSVRDNARRDPWLASALLGPAARLYLGDTPATDPGASPLYAEPGGLPPLLMHVVAGEILRDDTLRFAERARAAGVQAQTRVWRGLPHAFAIFAPLVPEARECIAECGEFTRRHCTKPAEQQAGAGSQQADDD